MPLGMRSSRIAPQLTAACAARQPRVSRYSVAYSPQQRPAGGIVKARRRSTPLQTAVTIAAVRETFSWRERVARVLDSPWVEAVSTVLTLYALFGDDARVAAASKPQDPFFFAVAATVMGIFSLELVVASVVKRGYFGSFFFWLDLVALLTLIPDAGMDFWTSSGEGLTNSYMSSLRAGRAARVGARSARIIRLVRMMRFFRLSRLLKVKQRRRTRRRSMMDMSGNPGAGSTSEHGASTSVTSKTSDTAAALAQAEPSNVSKRLAELTTKRVVLFVMALVIALPLLQSPDSLTDSNEFQEHGIALLHRFTQDKNVSRGVFRETLRDYTVAAGRILHAGVCVNRTACANSWPPATFRGVLEQIGAASAWRDSFGDIEAAYRQDERVVVVASGCYDDSGTLTEEDGAASHCVSFAVLDNRASIARAALNSVIMTLTVLALLTAGCIVFVLLADKVVVPVERLVLMVRRLAANPLVHQEGSQTHTSDRAAVETKLLERTIAKISGLLSVGFGEAGAEIIAKNMAADGKLDPLIRGKRVQAVIGFCDIRGFAQITEELQDEVLMFVNSVASIVHVSVQQFSGVPNRNLGEAFLLVWKLPATGVARVADNALAAFLKVQVDVHLESCSGSLHRFVTIESLREVFRARDGCRVHMGFGLHAGWAIEGALALPCQCCLLRCAHVGHLLSPAGAIGSMHKVDASYLSPNVNMAARLEAATRQYGASLLMSEEFVKLLSLPAMHTCRKVDRVTVKGSAVPSTLFTFDIGNHDVTIGRAYCACRWRLQREYALGLMVSASSRVSAQTQSPILRFSWTLRSTASRGCDPASRRSTWSHKREASMRTSRATGPQLRSSCGRRASFGPRTGRARWC